MLWATHSFKLVSNVLFLGFISIHLISCGGSGSQGGGPGSAPDIAFSSSGALDGSNAPNNTCTPFMTNHGFISTNGFNLWGANASGSSPRPMTKLTTCAVSASDPAWSPDGTRIAFDSNRALNGQDGSNGSAPHMWLMNADGSGTKLLTTPTTSAAGPAWSPDGSTIAFSDGNIWTVKSDGSAPTQLTKLSNASVGVAIWSPDGHKLAFISDRALDGSDAALPNLDSNVWLMNADGSAQQPLTQFTFSFGALAAAAIAWSRDGSKIAFDSVSALDGSNSSNGANNIWTMNPDGTNRIPLTKVTNLAQQAACPSWSPDSQKIAYISGGNVWVINFDGTGATQLTPSGAVFCSPPSWSPDGKRLAFTAFNTGATSNTNIWLINADGSGLVALTNFSGAAASSNGTPNAFLPVWRP